MKNQNPSQTIVNETHLAMRVSVISVIVNLVLSAFKLLAGIFANSGAMISDAVHSASDVFSTFIVMIGVTISGKKQTKNIHTDMSEWNVWLPLFLLSSSLQLVLESVGAVSRRFSS